MDLPSDLPLVYREAVRAVVVDAAGHVLLLRAHEATYPELGFWWELPGGGIESDETPQQAIARELYEETGLQVDPLGIGEPTWHRSAAYRLRSTRRVQQEAIMRVVVPGTEPACRGGNGEDYEREDYTGFRWVPVLWIESSSERFYPGSLPQHLGSFLGGHPIDEPFESWS